MSLLTQQYFIFRLNKTEHLSPRLHIIDHKSTNSTYRLMLGIVKTDLFKKHSGLIFKWIFCGASDNLRARVHL